MVDTELIDQVKDESQISDGKEITHDRTEIYLPKIADLPEKAQKKAYRKLEEAQQTDTETRRLLGQGEQDITAYRLHEPDFHKVAESCEKVTPEQQAEQDKKIQVISQQFEILKSAFQKLSHGQDAPELMEISPDFFDEAELHSLFTPQEVRKYKERSIMAVSLQRLKMKFSPKMRETNQIFQQKIINLLYQRGTTFLKKLEENVQNYGPEANKLLKDLTGEDNGESLDVIFERYGEIAKENASFLVPNAYHLSQLHEWFQDNADVLKEILVFAKGERQDYLIPPIVNQAIHKVGVQESWLKGALSQLKEKVDSEPKKLLLKKLNKYLEEFNQLATPIILHPEVFNGSLDLYNIQHGLDQSGQVWEVVKVVETLIKRRNEFMQTVEGLREPLQVLQKVEDEDDQDILNKMEQELGQAIEHLAKGQDILLHGTEYSQMKKILRRALLASRKTQIEVHGESLYNSADIEVGKDYVKVRGQKMTEREYEEKYKGNMGKSSKAEMNQVCFSENRPYRVKTYFSKPHEGNMHEGILLVFGKARLFARSQFTEWDGWHLFHQNFNDKDENSPGFSIDLTEEPFILLATEDVRGDLENFIKTELAVLPEWEAVALDPDKWIKEHIVYLSQKFNYSDWSYEEKILPQLREKLFIQFKQPEIIGRVLPTGNQGDCINSRCDLFAYQLSA